jgi:hypothetical protein
MLVAHAIMDSLNPFAAPQTSEPWTARVRSPGGSFGEALKTGLWLFTENLLPILIVTSIVWSPLEVLQAYCDYFVFEEDDLRSSFRLQRTLNSLFGIIATGAVIAAGDASLRGTRISAWQALFAGLAAWPRLFWTRLVRGFLLVLAFLALILPFIYVGFRLMLVETVVVAERRSGMDCIKRAWELAERRVWRITGLMIVTYFAVVTVSILLFVPLAIFPEFDHWLLSAALSLVADLLGHIPTLVLVAVYFQAVQAPTSELPPHPGTEQNHEA